MKPHGFAAQVDTESGKNDLRKHEANKQNGKNN
jgi:hypothetical protein